MVVSGLLCKHGVGVLKCLSDCGILFQKSNIASTVSVKILLKHYILFFLDFKTKLGPDTGVDYSKGI